MWKAAALSNGAWNPLTLIELPPEPFRSDTVRRIMRERFPNSPLIHYFEQEAESADAARDAIELWGTAAQAEAQEFDWDGAARVEALNEALGLYASGKPFPDRKDALATLAWHDRTGVIIPLLGEEERITVEYQPALRDEYRVARLQHNYATPEHRLETILDWRGYFGTGSLIGDGWTTMRRRGHGFIASVEGTVGYVVASVLRRLTRDPIEQGRDPTARRRLIAMSERYPQVAEACPDLSSIEPVAHDCAIVFVHGTVSCGIQGLKDLYPSIAFPLPIYRYEHDTFQPLHDNASELAELIATRIQVKRLLLAAHSRGGLVARLAQVELERGGYQADVSVFTFGTPHEGTPLVALGGKALNLLLKLGEDIAGTIPIVSPLTKAYSYLMEEPSLPRGIEVMREGSEGLLTMRLLGNPARVHCWGSNFDVSTAPSGFGVFVEGGLLGGFRDPFHDLVVPSASALGFGTTEPLLSCSHVHYFLQASVRDAIQNFCTPPPHQRTVVAGAAPRIEREPDRVVIAGVAVSKRPSPVVATERDITVSKPLVPKPRPPTKPK